ncbi:MAG: hypothetical protein ACREIF_14360 [Chthoniobacterales bacterium]
MNSTEGFMLGMTTLDWTIVSSAVCGLVMVVGGICLLYKGAITLQQAGPDEAVSLEFQKLLKIQTRYPALGLFIIGLAFVLVGLFYSPKINPVTLQGKVDGADPSGVTIHVTSPEWSTLVPDSDGNFNMIVYPDVRRVEVLVQAAGCKPESRRFTLDASKTKDGVLALPKMAFEAVAAKPAVGTIVAPPPNTALPPLEAKTTFN